jgi:redox-sensing transcriptional repressor
MSKKDIPVKTVERLVLYKRLLKDLQTKGENSLYSHQLAKMANNTPAQVRRDLMMIGYSGGTPRKGYQIEELIERITSVLEETEEKKIILVGIGNLGRAILSYFSFQHPGLSIVAAFDNDENKTNRVIAGCRCFHLRELEEKVKEFGATIGVITVPAQHAQAAADVMVEAGIKGILNFAPVPLKLPENVFNDRIDISMALEKIAYFAD